MPRRQKTPEFDNNCDQPIMKFNCEHFDPGTMDIDVWHIKFETSLQLAQVKEEHSKRLFFINCLNTTVLETIVNICKPSSLDDFTYQELYGKLKANYKVTKISVAERVRFFSLKQNDESINEFANTLRQSANNCNFPFLFYQQALITAFVMGVNNPNIKENLMQKDHESLSEVLVLANTLNSIQIASSKSVFEQECNLVRQGPCYICGGKHWKKYCRITSPVCFKCGSKSHITKMCRLKNPVKSVQSNLGNETLRASGTSSNALGGIHDVLLINKGAEYFPLLTIQIWINRKPVTMQFDTGSCVSIISETTWNELGKPILNHSRNCFTSFTGQTISLLGETYVQVHFGNIEASLKVYIASGVKQNIFGRDWIFPLHLHTLSLSDLLKTRSGNYTFLIKDSDAKIAQLCNEFKDVFKPGDNKCSKVPASLYLKENSIPVFKKARPVPLSLRVKVREELDRLIKNGVLTEIDHSEWAAPCVLVRKPDGSLRICADFSTGLNQSLEVQKFPLPTHEELFTKLGGGVKFTTLDLSDAYLSIPMDENSKKLLVINTIFGLMQYNRLCFGVAPATAIFQKRMYSMLCDLKGVAFLLDDIIITGKDDEEHLQTLEEVLKRIEKEGFCLNRNKCRFLQNKVNYLGLSISKEGISTNSIKIQSILDMPEPSNVKELETFVGMANFYAKFIPNFSDKCAPLNELRRKGVKWNWSPKCSNSIVSIKEALVTAPVLVPYNNNLPLVIAADASSIGIGCTIYHRYPNGEDKPIAFASKTLTSAERNYSQIEREALSIIYALKKFRIYLFGSEFLIQTDHRPLLSIFGSTKGVPVSTSCRLQRWALFLSSFNFKIEYVSTKKFCKVDCLSRLPKGLDKEFDDQDEGYSTVVGLIFSTSMKNLPITCKIICEETEKDPVLHVVKKYIVEGWPTSLSVPDIKPYEAKKNDLTIHEGCIVWGVRTIIPPNLRERVLVDLHETHQGMVKTKSLAREYIWWPNMDQSIERVSRNCSLCNTFAPREPQKKYLSSWPDCNKPWTRVHLDFAGPFLANNFLLVVDAYSRWLEVIKVNSICSEITVKQIKLLICRFGIPETLVTDNGTSFTSSVFKKFCEEFGIKHITTPVYHPSSNGQVEKYVHTMKNTLRKLCNEKTHKGLEADLNNFLFNFRLTPHISTGVSPAELFLGRRLRCKLDLVKPERKDEVEHNSKNHDVEPYSKNSPYSKTFKINQPIYWADLRNGKIIWKVGSVKKRLGKNVWLLAADGRTFKKHADQIRANPVIYHEEAKPSEEV